MLNKQAKVLTAKEVTRLLDHVSHSRHPERDRAIVLFSFKAGMRAKEIASVTWSMVTDASGEIADRIALRNAASKGRNGGREIPMHPALREALTALKAARGDKARPDGPIIYSERARGLNAGAIATWFFERYRDLGIEGASSHSGRRTFITNAAKRIIEAGGSLRDVQELAGHADMNMTARYIAGDAAAKRKVVDML